MINKFNGHLLEDRNREEEERGRVSNDDNEAFMEKKKVWRKQ